MPTLGFEINLWSGISGFQPSLRMLRIAPALVLLLGCFTLSCHKRPSKAPPPGAKTQPAPAIPSDFELAEARYAAGDFSAAASFYEEYLRSNPGKNQDLALYHLGLAYALQGATTENLEKSQSILQQFVEQYPGAARLTEATLLLSLQTEIKKLSAAAVQKQTELDSTKTKQRAEIDKLKDEIKEQQARIKTLAEELQRLRDIDMERRPSRPSR